MSLDQCWRKCFCVTALLSALYISPTKGDYGLSYMSCCFFSCRWISFFGGKQKHNMNGAITKKHKHHLSFDCQCFEMLIHSSDKTIRSSHFYHNTGTCRHPQEIDQNTRYAKVILFPIVVLHASFFAFWLGVAAKNSGLCLTCRQSIMMFDSSVIFSYDCWLCVYCS